MKKILSLLLAATLLIASVYITIPTVADTVSTLDDVTKKLGATDENLVWSEDFSTSAITERITVEPVYESNKSVYEVKDGKWLIGAFGGKDLTLNGGWTDISLNDFIASFEFTTKQGWGQSNFYYHSESGWPDAYTYRLNISGGAGYKATVTLEKKGDSSVKNSVSDFDLPLDTEFNVVIVSKGNTDSAYIWVKGTEAPTEPTVSITTDGSAAGDLYYYTYQDSIALDNISVYELNTMNTYAMETATGIEFLGSTPIYTNNLNTATEAPVTKFDYYAGESKIVKNKWQTVGEVGTATGLTGKEIKNFALGFQFAATDIFSGFYGDFAYHSTTGWANLNNENRLNVFEQNGKFTFVLNGKAGVSDYAATNYVAGDLINVVLTYIDKQVSAYIWKSGEEVPQTPTISITATEETKGDFYFHFSNATFTMDNFFVYDTADTRLYPEHIKAATGLSITEENLIYKNDFNTATEAPVKNFADYSGVSKIRNRKWQTSGEIGTSTGLLEQEITNFALGFQFAATDILGGFYGDFAYHSESGWANFNNENRLNVFGQNGKFTFVLNGKAGVSDYVATNYVAGDLINVVLTYIDKRVSAYIWKFGEEVPQTPTISITATEETKGDFYFHFSNATFTMDNFFLYNPVDNTPEEDLKPEEIVDVNPLTPEHIATATGLDTSEEYLIYKNNFNNKTDTAPSLFDMYSGNSEIKKGQWITSGEIGTSTGLSAQEITNFALGFQFTVTDMSNGFYGDFAYHSKSGWANLNNENRLNVFGQNEKLTFVLNAKAGVSDYAATNYVAGDLVNIVLTYIESEVSAYIWKFGEEVPQIPTISITATEETKGDFYFHLANATFTMDNFFLYDPVDNTPEEDPNPENPDPEDPEPENPEPEEIVDVNPLTPEHIATATGLDTSEKHQIYKNNFNNKTDIVPSLFDMYSGNSEIKKGQWITSGEIGTSTGLSAQEITNFALGFQFTVNDMSDGFYGDFAYHSKSGWANLNNENRLNVFEQNGKFTFVLNGKAGVSDYAATNYVAGDLINVVLTYIDKQVAAYIWKFGEEVPQIPTISITATEETKGDFYFHLAKANFTMDNFFVFDTVYDTSDDVDNNSLTPEDIKAVTGIDFSDRDLVYKSVFVNTKTTPTGIFDAYNGTSAILNNKWVTTGEIGTSTGLTGKVLKDFTVGFQFSVSDFEGDNVYADFAYHSETGWSNLNNDNRLNMFVKEGKLVFVLTAKEGQSRSIVTDYTEDDILNVVLTYSDKVIKFYIWKFGENLPCEPSLRVMGTTETKGDLYFHFARATFTMDDFYVYNNPIDESENAKPAEKVLVDSNFDTDGDLLFAAGDSGITTTKNGVFEFNTDGHKMLYSPLLADGEIAEDFSWQFTYIPVEITWNTDRFKFHCQGDKDSDSVYLQILGEGNASDGNNIQLVRVLNNNAFVLATAKVDIHQLNAYTIRIISENNNISVYFWKVGTSTPDKPLLTADSKNVILEKGGFMVEGFHTAFYLDDMKLYNYASGKQLTTYLPELPEEVLLANWNFNSLMGKTDFPFEAGDSLKYWQNTLQIKTPMKPERKQITTTNLVGDYELSDLSWEFDIREFESWAVDKFIIHSADGTSNNSVYLLFMGNAAKVLQGGFNGEDPSNSALRLIQVIDGKVTLLGTFDEETARGKGYSVKITCKDNNIDVWFGAKRTGKLEKVISAKADEKLASGQVLIESFNSNMWLDNIKISNSANGTDKDYDKSLYATVK